MVGDSEIVDCITGKSIFSWVSKTWAGDEAIEIVYPSQLSKEEACKFSVRGKPLEVMEYEPIEHEAIEHEVEMETDDESEDEIQEDSAVPNWCSI